MLKVGNIVRNVCEGGVDMIGVVVSFRLDGSPVLSNLTHTMKWVASVNNCEVLH